MTHRNAPLTPEGRRRLFSRCRHGPISHIAAEAGVSRQCLGKWVARYREHGQDGLLDRSSAPVSAYNLMCRSAYDLTCRESPGSDIG